MKWLERVLLVVGVTLGAWCIWTLLVQRHYRNMPVPPAAAALPSDAGSGRRPASVAAGTWLAKLEAPSVKMTATVLEGTDDRTLDKGAGHIEETPRPGQPGNIGIAGHRDTVFRPLRKIKVGDPLQLTTPGRIFHYTIAKTLIVGPDDVYVLNPTKEPTLTLVTCYPFDFIGHAPRRFIVQARLVADEARIDTSTATDRAGGAGRAGKAGG